MAQDWKEMLASVRGDVQEPESPVDGTGQTPAQDTDMNLRNQKLNIVLDKKGRKGKVATIIEGFTIDDDAVAEIASELKRKIGTGGSSRGGEILLQGDWKVKAADILRSKGFKC